MSAYTVLDQEVIFPETKDQTVNIVLHTIGQNKQVLIFNNSKSRSEATAERVANAIKEPKDKDALKALSEKILKALQNPTKQCRRLAMVVEKGAAFHHSGLTAKQRSLIETSFKQGLIKVISSTPTLAAGLNLPAYKVIINDYKRYSSRGYQDIPVLEFHQMAGRAGRPGREDIGKAVVMIKDESELDKIVPKYIYGDAEEIISKLAVEPTLKMYVLSLISMDVINTEQEIKEFFSHTLYAHQYQDVDGLHFNIMRVIRSLIEFNFVNEEDNYYLATPLGKKVSELYLSPDTAHYFLTHLDKFIDVFSSPKASKSDIFSLIYFIVDTVEMKPVLRLSKLEAEDYIQKAEDVGDELVTDFNPFEMDYEEFLRNLKTSDVFQDWINEAPEDYINEKYKITPGELHYRLEVVDWLLYCLEELSLLKKNFFFKNYLNKLRIRFKGGIKEELLPFVALKGVGRVRARKLHKAGFKKLIDLKHASFAQIARHVGDGTAIKIKEQIDERHSKEDQQLHTKPKEIKVREVSEQEVEQLVSTISEYEKAKEEYNRSLDNFF